MTGIITLLIAAVITWYVCAGTLPWQYLGVSITPLFDTALVDGDNYLAVLLALGTILATLASANGCINDASRAWFSMGRDNYLPVLVRRDPPALPHARSARSCSSSRSGSRSRSCRCCWTSPSCSRP